MTIRITFEAASVSALRAAVAEFFAEETARLNHTGVPAADAPAAEPVKRGRGRPPKAAPVAASAEFPDEVETPPAPAPTTPTTLPNFTAPAKAPDFTAPVSAPTKDAIRALLIEVVKQKGAVECGNLCRKHGGPNLSALDPKVYPAIYADAQAMLAAGEG